MSFGVLFDTRLLHESELAQEAVRAIKQEAVPFYFFESNGLANLDAAQNKIASMLGLPSFGVPHEQILLPCAPFARKLAEKPWQQRHVLVIGSDHVAAKRVAVDLGVPESSIVTPTQLFAQFPHLLPRSKRTSEHESALAIAPVQTLENVEFPYRIDTVLIVDEPSDYQTALQVVLDVVQAAGGNALRQSAPRDDQLVDVLLSDGALTARNGGCVCPRLAMGAFVVSLRAVYEAQTRRNLVVHTAGPDSKLFYEHVEQLCPPTVERLYFVLAGGATQRVGARWRLVVVDAATEALRNNAWQSADNIGAAVQLILGAERALETEPTSVVPTPVEEGSPYGPIDTSLIKPVEETQQVAQGRAQQPTQQPEQPQQSQQGLSQQKFLSDSQDYYDPAPELGEQATTAVARTQSQLDALRSSNPTDPRRGTYGKLPDSPAVQKKTPPTDASRPTRAAPVLPDKTDNETNARSDNSNNNTNNTNNNNNNTTIISSSADSLAPSAAAARDLLLAGPASTDELAASPEANDSVAPLSASDRVSARPTSPQRGRGLQRTQRKAALTLPGREHGDERTGRSPPVERRDVPDKAPLPTALSRQSEYPQPVSKSAANSPVVPASNTMSRQSASARLSGNRTGPSVQQIRKGPDLSPGALKVQAPALMSDTNTHKTAAQAAAYNAAVAAATADTGVAKPNVTEEQMLRWTAQSLVNRDDPRLRYEVNLERRLGKGGFGAVYLAVDKVTKQKVAIKQMEITRKNRAEWMLMETELHAKSSQHPNIVSFIDSFLLKEENRFWMVLEYIDGCTLEPFCDLVGFKEPQMAYVTRCVTQALDYVHHLQRVHRDIKLSNVLIGPGASVKLTDFGVAAQLTAQRELRSTMVGTPDLAAPEVMTRGQQYGLEVDVWALGMLVLKMCHCSPFVHLRDPNAVLLKLKTDGAPRLTKKKFSNEMKNFVEQCVQLDPTKRSPVRALLSHDWLTKADGTQMDKLLNIVKDRDNPGGCTIM